MSGLDTKVLENRLISKDSVVGTASLTKCAQKLLLLNSATEGQLNAQNPDFDTYIREVLLFKLEAEKSCKALENISAQYKEYICLEESINSALNNSNKEIQKLNQELHQEKEIRKHRIILEDRAKIINKKNSRSYLKRKMAEISDNIQSTNQSLQSIDAEIKLRQDQFNSLMTCLNALEMKLNCDSRGGGDNDQIDTIDEGDERRGDERLNQDDEQELEADNPGAEYNQEETEEEVENKDDDN